MVDWKRTAKEVRRADSARLAQLYEEVYGATYGGRVTEERARASILEACAEMLDQLTKKARTRMAKLDTLEELKAIHERLGRLIQALSGETAKEVAGVPAETEPPKTAKEKKPPKEKEKEKGKEKAPPVPTKEEVRELATRLNKECGMGVLMEVLGAVGAKKLSEVPENSLSTLVAAMCERLAAKKAPEDPKTGEKNKPESEVVYVSIDAIRTAGVKFVAEHGDPAFRDLLKTIAGSAKISETDPKYYPALYEALTNA